MRQGSRGTSTSNALLWIGVWLALAVASWFCVACSQKGGRAVSIDVAKVPPPPLFGDDEACVGRRDLGLVASRAERNAEFRGSRYPYDAQEGVRSVLEYGIALTCYALAGRTVDAARARRAQAAMANRVNQDYASTRLLLRQALEAKRWAMALEAVNRLRRLTAHLVGHDYAEWLERVGGEAAARIDSRG